MTHHGGAGWRFGGGGFFSPGATVEARDPAPCPGGGLSACPEGGAPAIAGAVLRLSLHGWHPRRSV